MITVEKLIPKVLNNIKGGNSYFKNFVVFIRRNLKEYYRQYFGYINKKGEKVIYINCFWNDNFSTGSIDIYGKRQNLPDWYNRKIKVDDGGKHYWRININLNTKKEFGFSVNGEA